MSGNIEEWCHLDPLQESPIIPYSYDEIRGIIAKNGAWGDGYWTLYEIMIRIHTIVIPDAQRPPPESRNFKDISKTIIIKDFNRLIDRYKQLFDQYKRYYSISD